MNNLKSEEILEALNKVQEMRKKFDDLPDIYMNEKSYLPFIERVGYIPDNVHLNNHLPDNKVICIKKQSNRMEWF